MAIDSRHDLQTVRFMALLEACQALSTSLVLDEVMDLVCKGVVKAFGLTSVDIYEYSAENDAVTAVWSFMPDDPTAAAAFVGSVYPFDEHPKLRRVFDERAIIEYHIDDEESERTDSALLAEMREWGEQSIIEIGLIFGDEIMGLLSMGSKALVVHLDDVERELLAAFAATAAIAMRNAELYRTIEEQAVRDGLTQLYNHRFFYERLDAELARGRRYGTQVALLMLDVDDFKRFNDRYGHRAGDEVLRAVAGVIAADLRGDIDIACRYGGEEFAVILPHTPDCARKVAERLRGKVAATAVHAESGTDLGTVTVSIGVAVFPGDGTESESLVTAADEALYRAKGAGKDCVAIAGE